MRITNDERRARLARRHLLTPHDRTGSVAEIADALVALHSSDPVSVFLAIAARSSGLSVVDVEHALYESRSVIRHHAMRRTLWVMTPRVAEIAHAACTRRIAAAERRRTAKLAGGDAWLDQAVAEVVELVTAAEGPVSTRDIGVLRPSLTRDIVVGAGTRNEARMSAHSRGALVAAFDGSVVRTRPAGSWIGSHYAWTDADRWIELDWDVHDEATGMIELVRRWLARFGPGTVDDLVWWTGATKGLVRHALAALAAAPVELEPVESGGGGTEGYVLVDDAGPVDAPEPWVAVLPALDPTAMGWRHRAWYLDAATARRVTDRNGNVGPTVWVDGRIVGGWAQRPGGDIAIEYTRDVAAARRRMIDDEVARLREFIGETRFSVRFPAPNQRDLLR